jgi:hypothetical protein
VEEHPAPGVHDHGPADETKPKAGFTAFIAGLGCFTLATIPIIILVAIVAVMYIVRGCGPAVDPSVGPGY